VGDAHSVEDLVAFAEAARIRDVVIDWAWITLHWDRTDFPAVEALVGALQKRGVHVAAMYRPRFKDHQKDGYDVAHQVNADGSPWGGHCEIRYADPAARRWGAEWAVEILRRCPSFDEVVIYNPRQACRSPEVVAAREKDEGFDARCVRTFLAETRRAMRGVKKEARLGLVLPPDESLYEGYAEVVDVVRPFLFVRENADVARDQAAALGVIRGAGDTGVALAKITWGEEDVVSDAFLGDFIGSARARGLKFVFWTFWRTFCDGRYDLDLLCGALDLDPAEIKPLVRNLGGKTDLPWDPEVVREAVREAAADTSADHFKRIAVLLGRFGEDAVEPLCELLDDRSEGSRPRWFAAWALQRLASPRALPSLLRNSRDDSAMVRWPCAAGLGASGRDSEDARRRLEEMADDDPAWRVDAESGERVHYLRGIAGRALERWAGATDAAEPFLSSLPWADTLEEARARGRSEGRLVIAFVNPFDYPHFEAGWKGAREAAEKAREDRESPAESDVGEVKERAMLVGMLAEPRMAAFLRDRCVLVRVRLNVLRLSRRYRKPPVAPLAAMGLPPLEVRPPSVVVCAPSGRVVAHASDLAFFCPELMHSICRTARSAEEEAGTGPPVAAPEVEDLPARLESLLDGGDLEEVRRLAADAPRGTAGAAATASAEADLLGGNVRRALRTLEGTGPPKGQGVRHAALLAEARLRLGDAEGALEAVRGADAAESPWRTRLEFLSALALDRLGRTADARRGFTGLVLDGEPGPWRARASLYVAENGPNPREWCPFGALDLPETLRSTETGRSARGPRRPGREAVPEAIGRAARYLLDRRRPSGVWEGSRFRRSPSGGGKGVDGSTLPRTALCVCALDAALPFLDKVDGRRAKEAIAEGREYVQRWSESPGRNIWDLTYALHLEMRFYPRLSGPQGTRRRGARARIRGLVEALAELQHGGGWTYHRRERLHTFNTAPILLSLARVREHGLVDVDGMIERAAAFLQSQRLGDASLFHYGAEMQHLTREDLPQGSSMRSPLCELALLEAGVGDGGKLTEGIELFFEHLYAARGTAKRFESWLEPVSMHDAYHFYFGTWYGARAIGRVEDGVLRRRMAGRLARAVLATAELDGGFVDGQIHCGRNSGTAMALMTLVACENARE
jgi:hypothetical protein